jgi:hypothetical protein
MKIESNDLISTETERSSRNLTIVSCIVLIIWRYDLKTSTASFFGIEIPAGAIHELALWLVVAMAVGHFLHWWGDFVSARRWFKQSRIKRDLFWSSGPFDPEDPPPEAAKLRFANALTALEQTLEYAQISPQSSESASKIVEQLEATNSNLAAVAQIVGLMGDNFRMLSISMWMLLIGWYLALPFGLAAMAIFASVD